MPVNWILIFFVETNIFKLSKKKLKIQHLFSSYPNVFFKLFYLSKIYFEFIDLMILLKIYLKSKERYEACEDSREGRNVWDTH